MTLAGPEGIQPLDRVFFDLFKGMLAFFLLDMGLLVARQLPLLKGVPTALLAYGLVAPLAVRVCEYGVPTVAAVLGSVTVMIGHTRKLPLHVPEHEG